MCKFGLPRGGDVKHIFEVWKILVKQTSLSRDDLAVSLLNFCPERNFKLFTMYL